MSESNRTNRALDAGRRVAVTPLFFSIAAVTILGSAATTFASIDRSPSGLINAQGANAPFGVCSDDPAPEPTPAPDPKKPIVPDK
jgi:hypothetical protein